MARRDCERLIRIGQGEGLSGGIGILRVSLWLVNLIHHPDQLDGVLVAWLGSFSRSTSLTIHARRTGSR